MGRGAGVERRVPARQAQPAITRASPVVAKPWIPAPQPQARRAAESAARPQRPMLPGNALDVVTFEQRPVRLSWGVWFGHIAARHVGRHLHLRGERARSWVFFPDYDKRESMELVLPVIRETLEHPDRILRVHENGQERHVYIRDYVPPVVAGPGPVPIVVPVALSTGDVCTAYPSTLYCHQAGAASEISDLVWARVVRLDELRARARVRRLSATQQPVGAV